MQQQQQHRASARRVLQEKHAQIPQPKQRRNPQVKQRKQQERKPWRSKVLQLFQPNLGSLRLPSAATLNATSQEDIQRIARGTQQLQSMRKRVRLCPETTTQIPGCNHNVESPE
eukprot:1161328-Pelagomonas_calceolata.AAC.3